MKKQVVKKLPLKKGVKATPLSEPIHEPIHEPLNESSNLLLLHLLSPIELTAHSKDYKPFNYSIGNKRYSVTQDFCYYLKAITKTKTELFLVFKPKANRSNQQAPSARTKNFAKFINTPVSKFRLSKQLINKLKERDIKTMSQVLYNGIQNVSELPYITLDEIVSLIELLNKNDSLALFLSPDLKKESTKLNRGQSDTNKSIV
jgi:hypothetical protein